MKKSRRYPSPAVDTAIAFMERHFRANRWPEGARIPATDILSREAGVSRVSMRKAIRHFALQKKLHARPGAGIFAGRPENMRSRETLAGPLAQQMLKDLLEGCFHNSEELPSVKELMAHYGVSFRIIQGALAKLSNEGHLIRRHRRYVQRRVRHASATILLVTGADMLVQSEMSNFRGTAELFTHYFELQCHKRNIRIVRATIEKGSMAGLRAGADALGCIIWATSSVQATLPEITEFLGRLNKRIAVFYHSKPEDGIAGSPRKSLRELHISHDDEAAGMTIGNALLDAGHRSVCYFSYHDEVWARERLKGLARAFSSAGYPDAVHHFPGADRISKNAGPQSPELVRAIADNQVLESMRAKALTSDLAEPYSWRVHWRLGEAAFWRWLYCVLESAMDRALKETNATAWVAADDYVGLYAILPFLHSRGVRIPRDLSVVGFNDQFEAAFYGLSSYHFDMTGMAMRILTFLLSPENERRLRPVSQPVEGLGGFLMDRGSVGNATLRPVIVGGRNS